MMKKRKKQKESWTHIGTGVHLNHPETILKLGFPDSFRKGHFWCFGTTRVGKTRIMEHIIEQDIRKGYSVVAIDPKELNCFQKSQIYLFPFVFHKLDFFSHIIFGSIPYLVLIINTAMCCYISRYYVGNITRKAINSLLMGRAMSLLLKAFLLYVVYLVLYQLSTHENIWKLSMQFGSRAEKIYYGFFEIKPHLMPVATKSSILMLAAAIFPYGSAYILDLWHRYRIKRNAKIISAEQ